MIFEVATTATILESIMYFVDENSKALLDPDQGKGRQSVRRPPDYARAFIKSSKKVLAKFEAEDPFFKKVLESQRKFAAPG